MFNQKLYGLLTSSGTYGFDVNMSRLTLFLHRANTLRENKEISNDPKSNSYVPVAEL